MQHITVDGDSAGQRLDNFLIRVLKGVPKTHVYRIIRSGEVRRNKGRIQADERLVEGDVLRLPPIRLSEAAADKCANPAPAREFPILFEDEAFLAIGKPAGVAVHGGSGVSFGVIEQLRQARPQASLLELVHRLDRETSGLLLIAKKKSALRALQDQFRERATGKTYLTVVKGAWPQKLKVLDQPLHKYLLPDGERRVMVSWIQSNDRGMGSGVTPPGLGFVLQDRGELFDLRPGHANSYAPGKRPFQTIIPAFLMKDGEPVMSFGLMGGSMQPQGHVQILVNMLDFGMNVQEAGDAARFLHDGGREPTSVDGDPLGTLYLEPGVPAQTVERLRAMGHKVEIDASGVRFGGYQAIKVDREKGSYAGATEMRKDGTVVAW